MGTVAQLWGATVSFSSRRTVPRRGRGSRRKATAPGDASIHSPKLVEAIDKWIPVRQFLGRFRWLCFNASDNLVRSLACFKFGFRFAAGCCLSV